MENITILKRLGVKRPETLGEMIKACRAIRAKAPNLTPITTPGVPNNFVNMVIGNAVSEVYEKNPRWDQQRSAGKVKFQTTPGWRTAVQGLKGLIDAKCFGPNVPAETFTQSVSNMVTQKAAMVWASSQLLSIMRNTTKNNDKYAMFAIPGKSKAKTNLMVAPSSNLAVNAKSSNLAA